MVNRFGVLRSSDGFHRWAIKMVAVLILLQGFMVLIVIALGLGALIFQGHAFSILFNAFGPSIGREWNLGYILSVGPWFIFLLALGIFPVMVGYGLMSLKRWAFCGALFLCVAISIVEASRHGFTALLFLNIFCLGLLLFPQSFRLLKKK